MGPEPADAVPPPQPRAVRPPPREAWQRPVRVEPVAGTPYGLAILGAPRATSGFAIGAVVVGAGAVLASLVVTCLGLSGAGAGWGAWVAGAFAVLTVVLAAGAVALGVVGMRQTRRAAVPAGPSRMEPPGAAPQSGPARAGAVVAGAGMAVAGLVCGAVALAVTLAALAATIAIQLG